MSHSFGIGEKTFDKYVWYGIKLMSEVDNVSNTSLMNLLIRYSDNSFLSTQIKFKYRFKGRSKGENNYVTLDGTTDFSTYDEKPFDKNWYSFKLK